MLNEIWRLVKASFGKRLLLYYVVVALFAMFGSIPIAPIKIAFLIAFLPTATLFLYILGKNLIIPNFRFVFSLRKSKTIPVPVQLQEIARKMKISLKEIKVIDCEAKNAFTTRNGIAFTQKLLDELNQDEIIGVAAHELGHKKGRHIFYRSFTLLPVILISVFQWSRFTTPIIYNETITQILLQIMMSSALLAFTIVALIPASWVMELKADEAAVRYAGKKGIRSALLKLSKPENHKERSESHPSIADRVERIDSLKIRNHQ